MANFLDFLFPKHCVSCKKLGSYLCENCFSYLSFNVKSLCLVCNNPSFNGLTHPNCLTKYSIDGCFSALPYNKTAQKLIYNFKYKPYLTDLKSVLVDLFYESLIQNEDFNRELKRGEWVFVPIPLFSAKLRKRGYNQAEILAKELSKKFNFKTIDILKRIHDTKTQVGRPSIERKLNIKGAFEIINHLPAVQVQALQAGKPSIINQNVFLIDDVATTGSTLLEAAIILKRNGVKRVIGLTLARD